VWAQRGGLRDCQAAAAPIVMARLCRARTVPSPQRAVTWHQTMLLQVQARKHVGNVPRGPTISGKQSSQTGPKEWGAQERADEL